MPRRRQRASPPPPQPHQIYQQVNRMRQEAALYQTQWTYRQQAAAAVAESRQYQQSDVLIIRMGENQITAMPDNQRVPGQQRTAQQIFDDEHLQYVPWPQEHEPLLTPEEEADIVEQIQNDPYLHPNMGIGEQRRGAVLRSNESPRLQTHVPYFPGVLTHQGLQDVTVKTNIRFKSDGKWYRLSVSENFSMHGLSTEGILRTKSDAQHQVINRAYEHLMLGMDPGFPGVEEDPCQLAESERVAMEYKRRQGLEPPVPTYANGGIPLGRGLRQQMEAEYLSLIHI